MSSCTEKNQGTVESLKVLEAETPTAKSMKILMGISIGLAISTGISAIFSMFYELPFEVLDVLQLITFSSASLTMVVVFERYFYLKTKRDFEQIRRRTETDRRNDGT
jgi:hypothetical protein